MLGQYPELTSSLNRSVDQTEWYVNFIAKWWVESNDVKKTPPSIDVLCASPAVTRPPKPLKYDTPWNWFLFFCGAVHSIVYAVWFKQQTVDTNGLEYLKIYFYGLMLILNKNLNILKVQVAKNSPDDFQFLVFCRFLSKCQNLLRRNRQSHTDLYHNHSAQGKEHGTDRTTSKMIPDQQKNKQEISKLRIYHICFLKAWLTAITVAPYFIQLQFTINRT